MQLSAPARARFVDGGLPNVPYLGRDTMNAVERAYMTLYATFWWSYDMDCILPDFEHRLLLLQLQFYIIYGRFTHFASRRRRIPQYDRMDYLNTLLTRVPVHTLGYDQRRCDICTEELDVPNGDGIFENPVVTSCRHGRHLFGKLCLREWLKTNATCPNCRFYLLPFAMDVRVEDPFGDEHDEAAALHYVIPNWLVTLLGGNPRASML